MNRFLFSILFIICLTPFQFGCGEEEAPLPTEEELNSHVDPAVEAEDMKNLN